MPTHPLIDSGEVRFFSGSSNRPLATAMARHLGLKLEDTLITRFSNDNLYIQLGASVRSRVVYIVQSLTPPVNDHLMELLMMIDIARSAAAREIHAVIPYYSFARSDKKDAPRISITARLVADLIERGGRHARHDDDAALAAGARLLLRADRSADGAVSLHQVFPQTRSQQHDRRHARRGRRQSRRAFCAQPEPANAYGNKDRVSDTKVRIADLMGHSIQGYKRALIYDDEIATGGSVVELCRILVEGGIEDIWISCTHGVFTGKAFERLASRAADFGDRHDRYGLHPGRKTPEESARFIGRADLRRGDSPQLCPHVDRRSV